MLAVYRELKNVILVDEAVDLVETDAAMPTRFVGAQDRQFVPGVAGPVLDPSRQPFQEP